MKLIRNVTIAALMYSGLTGADANAATLFQSVPDLTANPVGGACSPCDGHFRAFDTFSLATAATVGSVAFTVVTDFFFPTDVDVSIWTVGSGGGPGVQLLSHTFAPAEFVSVVNTPFNTSVVTVNPLAWSLPAGTYDISIFGIDGNLGVPAYSGGSGLLYSGTGLIFTSDPEGFSPGKSAGFALFSDAAVATPLPAALPLFATGLGVLGLFGWRRKRTRATVALMKFGCICATAICCALTMFVSAAPAATVFQSIPDLQAAPRGDAFDYCSPCSFFPGMKVFDLFSLNASTDIKQIRFDVSGDAFDADHTSDLSNVTVGIFQNASGSPGTQIFSQNFTAAEYLSDVQSQFLNLDGSVVLHVHLLTVAPTGLTLKAGQYWIAFYNDTSLFVDSYTGGSNDLQQIQDDTVFNTGSSLGFALDDTVSPTPLPAALPLFATGLGALGLLGWRRKRKQAANGSSWATTR